MVELGAGCVALAAAVRISVPYYCLWHNISDIVVVIAAVAVGSSSLLFPLFLFFLQLYYPNFIISYLDRGSTLAAPVQQSQYM
jgi:hypothetical protein